MDVTRTRISGSSSTARPSGASATLSTGQHLTLFLRNLLFRLGVVALLVGSFLLVRHAKSALWPTGGHPPRNLFDQVVMWGAVVWSMILPWAVADVAGWLIYRRHTPVTLETRKPDLSRKMPFPVVFRIVTRGDQPATVIATVWSVLETMQARPLFRYRVEVVSDMPIEGLPDHRAVHPIVVPGGYQTMNGATHKARALHYALTVSPIPGTAWVFHLDEESHVTESLIVGIRQAVAEEEASGELRIGQGLITYQRDLASNKVYSMADSIRVGDDLGRFHLQYRLHRILFGMHGSFLLVRSDVEKRVGFDFPPEACTTEDTTWALRQRAAGCRFRWVEGTVVEQSPGSFRDFVRQRRRWFTGMWWAARMTPVPAKYRRSLWFAMFLWTVGWTGFAYSMLHVLSGVVVPPALAITGDAIFAVYLTNYLLGLWVSLSSQQGVRALRRVGYFVAQAVLIPVFTVIEASAVVYSLVKPERRFHVVRKPTDGGDLVLREAASSDPAWYEPSGADPGSQL